MPVLTVKPSRDGEIISTSITSVKWTGLRCTVTVEGAPEGASTDLRLRAADPTSSLSQPRLIRTDGSAAMFVEDDRREGDDVQVVVLGQDGKVLAQNATIIGG